MRFKHAVPSIFGYALLGWFVVAIFGVIGISFYMIEGVSVAIYCGFFGVFSWFLLKMYDTEVIEILEDKLYIQNKGAVDYTDGIEIQDIDMMYLRPVEIDGQKTGEDKVAIFLELTTKKGDVIEIPYKPYVKHMWHMAKAIKDINDNVKCDTLFLQDKENFDRILLGIRQGVLLPQSYLGHDEDNDELEEQ